MNTSKIIKAIVNARGQVTTAQTIKENYGIILKIEGAELPEVYQVDFCNSGDTRTITMVGNADGVLIPKQFIDTGKDIDAYLYYVGDGFGKTVYQFHIPNKYRPDRTNEPPTPEEQSTIDQCISALNEAVAQTAEDRENADASAQSASEFAEDARDAEARAAARAATAKNHADRAEQAKDDAQTYANNASASATASAQSEENARGYAQRAEGALEEFTTPTASATTLPEGASATASYSDGNFAFGIPKGQTGDTPTITASKTGKTTSIYVDGSEVAQIEDGTDGDDGYSPTASVTKSGKVATITITDKNGTTSAQVEDGTDGTDGVSSTVTITPITGGHRITITDADGEHSADVMDGDDYILTAQDKQDIAELVDVPVDDVQINGTSIVENGVANVPTASASRLGVVQASSSQGIYVNSNGVASIAEATSANIKTGTNVYKPITPHVEHEATFYGLAKASGDATQSQSSNVVGEYTEEAKIAIQKMLGLYKAPYRLIKTIEITEETGTITIVADDNGDAFALTDVIVYFDGMVANGTSNGVVSLNNDTLADRPFVTLSNLYNTTVQTRDAKLSVDGGRFIGQSSGGNFPNSYNTVAIQQNKNACGIIQHDIIDTLIIGSLNSHKFTSGTITIYGR